MTSYNIWINDSYTPESSMLTLKMMSNMLNIIRGPIRQYGIIVARKSLKKIYQYFLFSTVSADVLAPLGARTSAGTVMTKFKSNINTDPA